MKYVVDTNVFRTFFRFYYEETTPELYENFYKMIDDGILLSVRECYNELEKQHKKDSNVLNKIKSIKKIFKEPTKEEEIETVKRIYMNTNFRNNIKEQNICNGMPVADAFLVAKARSEKAILVTSEEFSPNAAKIPNICKEFNIECINMREFLKIIKNYK